jgi:hexosaminidase
MQKGFLTAFFCAAIACSGIAQQAPQLIPQPVSLKTKSGHFVLGRQTAIVVPAGSVEAQKLGNLLAGMLATPVGHPFAVTTIPKQTGAIRLKLNAVRDTVLGEEGYQLKSSAKGIIIIANDGKGLFYGIQTLMQLLPPDIEAHNKITGVTWDIPAVDITDHPRFGWRGLMLDVSRHFFSKKVVEDYIDEMAKYKFNTFHMHLADDEGWRIEIKSLPELTKIGAWRVMRTGPFGLGPQPSPKPGEPATYGGFYTQDDMREIIKYAADRYITIMPEIDVPAHSLALIAAFPNLSCTKLQYPVNPGSPFYMKEDNVLCVANDSTYMILDKIFTEIAQIFPCPYIHVGGDEAYKGFWEKDPKDQALMQKEGLKTTAELQAYFEKKVEQIVNSKGKKLIGWDEIVEGGLPPSATVMSWRGIEGGIAAAKQGHQVVMTPWGNCYLDLYQGSPFLEPHTYGQLWLRDCYNYEPVPDSVDAKLILGGQGNLWTESVTDERQLQYMTWPRAMALSEVFWSPKEKGTLGTFIRKVETHFKRLDAANIKYAKSIYDPLVEGVKMPGDTVASRLRLDSQVGNLDIYYTFDTSIPDAFSPKYNGTPVAIPIGAGEIKAITYHNGKPIGREVDILLKDLVKKKE